MSQLPNNGIQLTQEEIDKRLNKFYVNDDLVNMLFNPDAPVAQRKQILQQIIDGSARHAITASTAAFEHRFGEHQKVFADTDRIAREMYRDRMFDKFFGKYGTLKEYRKLVEDSVAALGGREDLPSDEDKLFELIANEASARVKPLKPDFTLVPSDSGATGDGGKQSSQQQTQQHQQSVTPSSTDTGGYQGGTASSRSQPVAAGKAADVWDD